MNVKEKLSKKSVGFYIAMIAALFGLVALIMYIVFLGKVSIIAQKNPWILILMILGILSLVSLLFVDDKYSDIVSIGAIILFIIALGIGMQATLNNIVDYIQGIIMFGDSSVAILNIAIVIVEVLCVITIVVSTFFKNEKELFA